MARIKDLSRTVTTPASDDYIAVDSATYGTGKWLASSPDLPSTTYASRFGIINKNGIRFIHDFNYGNNGTVTTLGDNIFVGRDAGNLEMGATATQPLEASHNIGVGSRTLISNEIGYNNNAYGLSALSANTRGYNNCAYGVESLRYNTVGYNNSAYGQESLRYNKEGYNNSAYGQESLYGIVDGYYNVGVGFGAGKYISDGITINSTSNTSVYLGANTKALSDGDTNEIVIGYDAIGNGSDTATYGNTSMTAHYFTAGDIIVQEQGKGLVLRDSDGLGYHRITVNSEGVLEITAI